jgi:hypothetical protein
MIPQSSPFHQTETPSEGKHRNRSWQRHLLLLSVLVITIVSGAFFITRTHAAGGTSGETSNLDNRYLDPQGDVFPGRVYRGDLRSPDQIFRNGFTAPGIDYDLELHIQGNPDTGYIATTGTLAIAEEYAYNPGLDHLHQVARDTTGCSTTEEFFYTLIPIFGQFLLASCIPQSNGTILLKARTYVYEIDPAYARNAYYVPTEIRANQAMFDLFNEEDEWAFVYEIPTQAIVGVHVYEMTANRTADGTYDQNTIQFTNSNLFIGNPNYGGTTAQNPHYNPGNDSGSGWNYDTDIDLPTASCPVDPTVFQHCG